MVEEELLIVERAFPEAQRLLAGIPERSLGELRIGWHDTVARPETGAAAAVRTGSALEDLVGEVLRVAVGARSAYVYVAGAADLATDLSLARRAFLALAPLSTESVTAHVEVVV